MLHITCDHCGRSLEGSEAHFVVRVEIFAAHTQDQGGKEADLDVDHMKAVSQILEDEEEAGYPDSTDLQTCQLRFDLCQKCRTRYLHDPLGKGSGQKLHFSEN